MAENLQPDAGPQPAVSQETAVIVTAALAVEKPAAAVGKLEIEATILFAGKAAERRSLRGSAPGWRRMRTLDELRAHHEAGHGVAQWVCGLHPWRLSIVPDEGVRMGKTGFSGGYAVGGATPEPTGPIERPERAESDLRQVARTCSALALLEPPHDWRAALRIAYRLKARARDLVDGHWPLIARLAAELVVRRELAGAEIEAILGPRMRDEGR